MLHFCYYVQSAVFTLIKSFPTCFLSLTPVLLIVCSGSINSSVSGGPCAEFPERIFLIFRNVGLVTEYCFLFDPISRPPFLVQSHDFAGTQGWVFMYSPVTWSWHPDTSGFWNHGDLICASLSLRANPAAWRSTRQCGVSRDRAVHEYADNSA